MQITAARIQHFKSLRDVSLDDLSRVTLLVGANAVGKSNLIDAFRFLRDAVVDGLDHAISSRGGIEIIRQYSPSRPFNIQMRVEFEQEFDAESGIWPSFYEVKISSLGGGNYRVEHEEAEWWEEDLHFEEDGPDEKWVRDGISPRMLSRDQEGKIQVSGDAQDTSAWRTDELALRAPGIYFRNHPLVHALSGLRFSALYPNTLRLPSRPDTDRRLKESGENWASILKSLRQSPRGRQAFESIIDLMRRVMPSLQDVKVIGVGGYLVPRFVVRDTKKGKEHSFDPVQLSDGTLRIFGILLGLYQVPSPMLFAVEEPEQTVNPGVLAVLADGFREVSKRTQLFVTTHSPHLVDFFEPEQVRIVTLEAGETKVNKIKASQVESVKEHLITLQELLARDNLLPEDSV